MSHNRQATLVVKFIFTPLTLTLVLVVSRNADVVLPAVDREPGLVTRAGFKALTLLHSACRGCTVACTDFARTLLDTWRRRQPSWISRRLLYSFTSEQSRNQVCRTDVPSHHLTVSRVSMLTSTTVTVLY